MKKFLSAALAATLLAGCSSSTTTVTTVEPEATMVPAVVLSSGLKILSPQGAPALSLIPVENAGNNEITTVDGSDPLQAAFVSPDSEYDVIIAPTNLGVKLAANGKTNYKLMAIVDWGNLYLVGNAEKEDILNDETATITAFGQDSVPGLVFSKVYDGKIAGTVNWVGTAQESMAALVAGQCDAALLAEPVATAAIAKAKENGINLEVISDVQSEWGEDGFPMAGMFVNVDHFEEKEADYNYLWVEMQTYALEMNEAEDKSALVEDINQAGVEFYGVSSAEVISKCYDRMNITISPIEYCKDQVAEFLELFGVEVSDDVYAY